MLTELVQSVAAAGLSRLRLPENRDGASIDLKDSAWALPAILVVHLRSATSTGFYHFDVGSAREPEGFGPHKYDARTCICELDRLAKAECPIASAAHDFSTGLFNFNSYRTHPKRAHQQRH
jgi:hypothetical protein